MSGRGEPDVVVLIRVWPDDHWTVTSNLSSEDCAGLLEEVSELILAGEVETTYRPAAVGRMQ